MLITLIPKSLKGETRLSEAQQTVKKRKPNWDSTWLVGQVQDVVSFNRMAGPWLFIFPQGADTKDFNNCSRWVHKDKDVDFEVSELPDTD